MKRVFVILILLHLFIPSPVSAHKSGCHRWHSCPSDTGSYVCGDLGYTSECGGVAQTAPVQSAPVQQVVLPTNKPIATRLPTRAPTPSISPTPTNTPIPTLVPTSEPIKNLEGLTLQTVNTKPSPSFFSMLFSLFFGK